MTHVNVEIKAGCHELDRIRNILKELGADFKGTDHQIDTYFRVPSGRLKLFYEREDQEGPKQSRVTLFPNTPGSPLKTILQHALGELVCVDKTREIYFLDSVKFHLDSVMNLGTFVEIEAIDIDGSIGKATVYVQCQKYIFLFGISSDHLISHSYSDLLLKQS